MDTPKQSIIKVISKCINKSGINILVAFSGGRDSITLFKNLYDLQDELKINILVAYINHNLRTDSNNEELFVDSFFEQYKDVKVFKKVVNKSFWGEIKGESIESAARKVRYDFFRSIEQCAKIDYIATAHHFDDKIETFFINLFRAGGIETLSAIPERRGNIIRPLIHTTRDEINKYIEANNIEYYEDYTNSECKYLRNKVRNKILPTIRATNKNYYRSFEYSFDFLDEETEFIKKVSHKSYKKCVVYEREGLIYIDRNVFKKCNKCIQKHILKQIFNKIDPLYRFSAIIISNLTNTDKISLETKNIYVVSKSHYLYFVNKTKYKCDKDQALLLQNKAINITNLPCRVRIGTVDFELHTRPARPNNYTSGEFVLRYDSNDMPLELRYATSDDVINLGGTKRKVLDLMDNIKVPPRLSANTIVIVTNSGIIAGFCVFGIFRVSDDFFVQDGDQCLNIIL